MRHVSHMSVVVVSVALFAFVVATAARSAHPRSNARAVPTVSATLSEMGIAVSPTRVPVGKVTFVARNAGTVEHELLVIRVPRAGKLPIAQFKADERASLGEVPELKPGKTGRVTLTLRAGRYLLICNVLGHYQLGMHARITVVSS